jgi:SAM-dependent methyltransferase
MAADCDTQATDGHLMEGVLHCGCGCRYPLHRGIPRLTPRQAELAFDARGEQVAARFAAEWQLFARHEEHHERQFLDWVAPLTAADFRDAVVLEAGCGKGRHSALMAQFGARAVVAMDLGAAVEVAFAATRHLPAVHVVQGDLLRAPVHRCFDLAISVGVLHHLEDPAAGFRALCGRVRPGGQVAAWVYGYESNEWLVRLVNPLREVLTARLPPRALYWLSLPPTALLRAALPVYRQRLLARHLPYGAYLHYISRFPLREIHAIVFDQLVTPVAHYLREEEVRAWLRSDQLHDARLSPHNGNSWRATARIREATPAHRDPPTGSLQRP